MQQNRNEASHSRPTTTVGRSAGMDGVEEFVRQKFQPHKRDQKKLPRTCSVRLQFVDHRLSKVPDMDERLALHKKVSMTTVFLSYKDTAAIIEKKLDALKSPYKADLVFATAETGGIGKPGSTLKDIRGDAGSPYLTYDNLVKDYKGMLYCWPPDS